MGQIISARSTCGRITQNQKTIDLPGDSDTPAEIDLNENALSIQIYMGFKADIYATLAEDASEGLTRISSNDSRTWFEEGSAQISIVGQDMKLYVRRVSGSALTGGLTYWFTEAD